MIFIIFNIYIIKTNIYSDLLNFDLTIFGAVAKVAYVCNFIKINTHTTSYKFLLSEPYLPPLLKIIAVIKVPNINKKCATAV